MTEYDAAGPTGNRARDHLANERTYLAWLRTALAVVALGAVTARVSEDEGTAITAAAIGTVAFGVVALIDGTARYYRVAEDLDHGRFRAARRGPLIITGCLVMSMAVLVPLVLIDR